MEGPAPLREDKQLPPLTPTALLYFPSPSTQTRATSLYDVHELMALTAHLSRALTPLWQPNPKGGGRSSSTLYDSHELKAIADQLNGALHAARRSLLLYQGRRRLGRLHIKKARKLRPVAGRDESANHPSREQRGLLLKIWKKLKQAMSDFKAGHASCCTLTIKAKT